MKKRLIVVSLFLMFAAGLTFFVKPSKAASVTIISHTGFKDEMQGFIVYGEVQNLGPDPVYFVEINASFYDNNNNLIADGWAACNPHHILPDSKASFVVWPDLADETQTSRINYYALEATTTSREYPVPPFGLKILSSNAIIESWGMNMMHITGEIENAGTTSITSKILVIGTCYDSDGKVIDVSYDFPEAIDPILIGQNVSFELSFRPEVVPLAKSYALTAQSDEYICFLYPELPTPTPSTPSITILSYSEVTEVAGEYLVFGEIMNLGTSPVYWVEINSIFYDSSNTLIAEGWGICDLNVILPNRKSPFTVWVHGYNEIQAIDIDETLASKIDHYSLEATPSSGILSPDYQLFLKILSSSANLDSISGGMTITGEIELTDATSVSSNTRVSATLYDSDGRVVAVSGDNLDQLLPGQKASFEIAFWPDIVTKAKSYGLTAGSVEYGCFEYSELPTPTPSQTPEPFTSVPPIEASAPTLETTVWVASPENAVVATTVTVVAVCAASVVAAVVSNTAGMPTGKFVEKTNELIPESVKKWLSDYISSKRESTIEPKTEPFLLPTKSEVLTYGVSLAVLTLSFSYVKANDLSQIFSVLPNILVSAIIIEFVKTFILAAFTRSRGVWTEHKIWYLGLAMFLVTTFVFGIPFSSPSRNVFHTTKLTKHIKGIVSSVAILVVLAFAALFFGLMIGGFVLIGSTGLAMCSIMAFLDTFPVVPMNGKAIYEYSKVTWVVLFAVTLTLYGSWLIFL